MAATSKQSAKVIALPTPATTAAFGHKHRLRKWIVWFVLALLVAAAGWYWRSYSQTEITFQTAPVEHGSIQASIIATGTLNPVVNVQVGSQVSGNIKALYADFNTKVKQGQLVALIDPQIFQAQEDQAAGALGSAEAAVV